MTSTIQWSFTAKEISLIESRNRTLRLYFALLLKHYQYAHEFLKDLCSIPKQVIFEVAKVLNVPAIIYQPSKASLKSFYSTIRLPKRVTIVNSQNGLALNCSLLSFYHMMILKYKHLIT